VAACALPKAALRWPAWAQLRGYIKHILLVTQYEDGVLAGEFGRKEVEHVEKRASKIFMNRR